MTPSISKPDPAAFRKYLLGESSEAESASVEAYLESNPDLTPMPVPPGDDTLLACLRGQADVTPVESPQIRRAMEWLKNVGIDSSPDALTNLSDFTADKDTDDAADEVLRLLGKSDASGGFGELGGYKILRVLGRGGMGVVLEAEDPKLSRRVALKAMRPNIANNATAKQRFLREAKSAAKVENDHIVPIYQVGEDRGILFLAMPYLKGEPLDAKLKREQKLPAAEVARIGRQVAEGLAAAHEAGLVHRDIKPANIWLEQTRNAERGTRSEDRNSPLRVPSSGFRAKILDFGLARLEGPQDVQITGSGTLLGTPAYMAPEQASGKQVDARADLFSLGVVLYRAATGALPFKGDTPMAILTSLAIDTPSHASLANLELPTAIGDLIARLLEKDPAKRPSSAQEVAKAFADIQSDLAGDTIPVGLLVKPIVAPLDPWDAIDDPTPNSELGTRNSEQKPVSRDVEALRSGAIKQRPRKKLLIAGGLLALAAAIAAVVIVIIKDKDGKEVARINVPEGGSFEVKDEGKGKKDGPKPVADADRKAAEWALSIGGTVTIDDGIERKINSVRDLPAGPFTLKEIVVERNGRVTDASLKKLAGLKSLQMLDLGGTDVTDAGLKELSGLKSVKTLSLWGTQVTDAGLKELAGLQNLELLFLNATKITGTGFKELTGLQSFRTLNLDGVQVTEAGLKELANLKNLEGLSLFGTPLTEAGLKVLAGLQNLQWLNLGGSTVTDAGLKELSGLKNLWRLMLHATQVSNDGLEHLKELKALTSINLTQSKVTAEGVKKLAAALPYCSIEWDGGTIQPQQSPDRKAAEWFVKNQASIAVECDGQTISDIRAADKLPNRPFTIRSIRLSGKTALDGALENLRQLNGVESLILEGVGIEDGWLDRLASFPGMTKSLTNINLNPSQITDGGMAYLKRFSNLQSLTVRSPTLTDKGLAALGGLKLRALNIAGLGITDGGMEHLRGLVEMYALSLWQTSVGDAGLLHLKTLPIGQLQLVGGKFTDRGLKTLAEFPKLYALSLGELSITDQSLAVLKDCRVLSKLYVNNSKVTDAGLAHLTGLDLVELQLNKCAIGDAGLETLAKLKKLHLVHLLETKVTEAGVKKLAAALPKCTIYSDYGTFAPISPDRKAAEWFVNNQASINVECDGQPINDIRAADKLPNRPFTIRSISLTPKTPLDGALENLRLLTGVESMNLDGLGITDAWLDRLASYPGIVKSLKHFDAGQITDGGMAHLKRFSNLYTLSVNSPTLTEKGLAALSGIKLHFLHIGGTGITDAGMEHLRGLVELQWLSLLKTSVTDAGLIHLKTLPALSYLILDRGKFTDLGFKTLAEFPKLVELGAVDLPITDLGLAALKDCRSLRNLAIHPSKVTDAGVAHLTGLDNLSNLDLSESAVGDAGLETLAKLKKLTHVHLKQIKATEAGVKKLAAALPQCTINSDYGTFAPIPPDRKAAEWVLKNGGTVNIGGQWFTGDVGKLPVGPFKVNSIGLGAPSKVDDLLENLRGLTILQQLDLRRRPIGDADLERLASHPTLEKGMVDLCLGGGDLTDSGLVHLKRISWIHTLRLSCPKITDAGLRELRGLKVTYLLLDGSTNITDAGMEHVREIKSLLYLSLIQTSVGDVGLAHFKGWKNLTSLDLRKTKVTAAGIDELKKALPQCKIEWDGGVIEPQSDPDRRAAEYVLSLGRFPGLGDPVSVVKKIDDLPRVPFQLTSVTLASLPQVTDAGLAAFQNCGNLTSLLLYQTQVGDAGLEHLKGLAKLMKLDLRDTKVTAAGVAALQKALPKCQILSNFSIDAADRKAAEWVLSIGGIVQINGDERYLKGIAELPREPFQLTTIYMDANRQITDEDLAKFKDCKNLTSLSLADTKVTDAGLAHFKGFTKLTGLNLHNTQTGDAGLANFKECKNLIGLHLSGTKTTDVGLAYFKDCKNLTQLGLAHTQVTDLGLAYFKDCKNMVSLNLHDMKVSDAGLGNFKDCKDLQSIGLRGTPITDKGLAPFHDCKKLTALDLVQTKVTQAGIDVLKKALPQCKIGWDGGVIEPKK